MKIRNPFTTNTNPGDASGADAGPGVVHAGSNELVRYRLQARDLCLDSRQPARSVITGAHASRFRGRGMDYLESRNYQPGDDIRSMDWRVTARTGRAHVKLYQEERERPVVVMIDLGPGMFFATRGAFKSVIAARAAALIGWAAVQNGDRIGALLFNGGHHEIRPQGGQRGVLRLLRELVKSTGPDQVLSGQAAYNAQGHLNDALVRLRRVASPGSLVFIHSDFYAINEDSLRHLQALRQHNDIVACQVVDPLELQPPAAGCYAISDGEQNGLLDTRTARQRDAYTGYFENHHRAVTTLMQQTAVRLQRIATTDDVAESLRQGLASPLVSAGRSPGAAA